MTAAKEAIQKSYLKLSQAKGYENISVKALCAAAHVSRSTFYVYYRNTADVLEEIERQIIYELIQLNPDIMIRGRNNSNQLDFFHRTVGYIEQHQELFRLLLVEWPEYHFINKLKDAVKYHFGERVFKEKNSDDDMMLLDMLAAVVVNAYSYLIKYPYDINEQRLLTVISHILKLIDEPVNEG